MTAFFLMMKIATADLCLGIVTDGQPHLRLVAFLQIIRRAASAHLGRNPTGIHRIRVNLRPTPCDRLKATVFANFAAERTLMRDVRISELNPGLQLYLTPAGTGCISVKKELFR